MDDCLYTEPQYELVYTLDNTSDSRTEFRDAAGTVHSLWAEPNSLLIIRCAPPPERNRRDRDGSCVGVHCHSITDLAKGGTRDYDERLW